MHGNGGNDTLYGNNGDDTLYGDSGNDNLYGGNGDDTLIGGIGNDNLYGNDGDDILDGGTDDDNLYGGYGNDTYRFGFGDGYDFIEDDSGANVIELKEDVSRSDVTFERVGNDFQVRLSDGSTLKVYRGGDGDYPSNHMTTIRFANGVDADIDVTTLLSNTTVQGSAENDVLRGNPEADVMHGNDGNDTLYGNYGNDTLYGDAGDDTLYGHDGDDVLDGGTGNNHLYGGAGNDTYELGFGSGQNYVEDSQGLNVIRLKAEVFRSDVTFSREVNDFIISLSDGSTLRVHNGGNGYQTQYQFSKIEFANGVDADIDIATLLPTVPVYGTSGNDNVIEGVSGGNTIYAGAGDDVVWGRLDNDVIYGEDGNDVLNGNDGNDILDGGTGNNTLYGGNGDDTYLLGFGGGHNYVEDNSGANVIELKEDVSRSDVTFERIGNDFQVRLSDGSTLRVYNGGNGNYPSYHMTTIRFANGVDADIDVAALLPTITVQGRDDNETLIGVSGNETINGNGGNDTLYGGNGNDFLNGGEGNDYLYGGNGNDTYIFGLGYGHDYISDDSGINVIRFNSDVSLSDLSFHKVGDNLKIQMSDGSSLTVQNGCSSASAYHIATLQFSNGTDADIDLEAMLPQIIENSQLNDQTLTGSDSSDVIHGNNGNDVITGGDGDDILYGDDGWDNLNGGDGNDALYGGAGYDTLYGNNGNDVLDGGADDDNLYGGEGNDTYKFGFGDGNDYLEDNAGTNIIELKASVTSADVSFKRETSDLTLFLNDGSTLLIKDGAIIQETSYHISTIRFANGIDADIDVSTLLPTLPLQGKENGETLYALNTSDTIYGNGGNDTLYGGSGNDILYGDAGNDELYGESGNDVLNGGTGNNRLYGGAGDDTYELGFGGGYSYVEDSWGTNSIRLEADVSLADVTFERIGNDFQIRLSDDSILRVYYGSNGNSPSYHISTIRFANGIDADINVATLLPTLTVQGRESSEYLYGLATADTMHGNDGNDTLYGRDGNDTLYGDAGDDELYGESGNDVLNGGTGNNRLYGGAGDDTYELGFGGGYSYVEDNQGTNGIRLEDDVSLADVTFERIGNDFQVRLSDNSILFVSNGAHASYPNAHMTTISFANGTDTDINVATLLPTLTVQGRESSEYLYGLATADTMHGNDGNDTLYGNDGNDTLYGDAGNDNLYGGNGDDTLIGGAGNDTLDGNDGNDVLDGGAGDDNLYGGYGNDTYLFGFGDGHDYIEDNRGTNVIKLKADVTAEDVTFERIGNDFQIRLSDGSTLLVYNGGHGSYASYHMTTIKFMNGIDADVDVETLLPTISVQGREISEDLYGTNGSETIHGNDGNDTLYGNDGNDTLYGDAGNDNLYGGNGDDTLIGGAGNDTLDGNDGNDVLDGGAGDDNLYGGYGNDTYLFGFGDGHDYIEDNRGTNVIKLKADVTAEDVTFERIGDDLVLSLSDGSALRIYRGGGEDYSSYHVPTIRFANGTDTDINIENILSSLVIQGTSVSETLIGENRDDILDGKSGNDTLQGRNGNDTYRFGFGDGNDIIEDTYGTNIIEMKADVSAADLSFKRELNDLVITLRDGSSIKMNVDSFSNNHFSKISFANGVDADIQISALLPTLNVQGSVYDDTLYGTQLSDTMFGGGGHDSLHGGDGNDILYGNAENDNLYGGNGNDILNGGEGNDLLYGGEGNDTYIFGRGYDHDTISDTQGENSLYITQADYDNLWFTRDGNNLKVSVLGTEDTVTINSWYSDENARLSQIQTDMRTIGTADIELLVQAMSSFSQPNMDTISQDISLSNGFKETVAKLWHTRT